MKTDIPVLNYLNSIAVPGPEDCPLKETLLADFSAAT